MHPHPQEELQLVPLRTTRRAECPAAPQEAHHPRPPRPQAQERPHHHAHRVRLPLGPLRRGRRTPRPRLARRPVLDARIPARRRYLPRRRLARNGRVRVHLDVGPHPRRDALPLPVRRPRVHNVAPARRPPVRDVLRFGRRRRPRRGAPRPGGPDGRRQDRGRAGDCPARARPDGRWHSRHAAHRADAAAAGGAERVPRPGQDGLVRAQGLARRAGAPRRRGVRPPRRGGSLPPRSMDDGAPPDPDDRDWRRRRRVGAGPRPARHARRRLGPRRRGQGPALPPPVRRRRRAGAPGRPGVRRGRADGSVPRRGGAHVPDERRGVRGVPRARRGGRQGGQDCVDQQEAQEG